MNTAQKVMDTARLQAACEYAWRLSNHQNKRDWQRCEQRRLPLTQLLPRVLVGNPDDYAPPESPAELPHCIVTAYHEPMGIRLIITAPNVDNDFFWVAGRIDFKGRYQANYTSHCNNS